MKASTKAVYETCAQIVRREAFGEGIKKVREITIECLLLKTYLSEADISDGLEVLLALVQKLKEKLVQSGRLDGIKVSLKSLYIIL